MRLHSRAGVGLLKKFLFPANCPSGKSAGSLKSLRLPPSGGGCSRLPARSPLPTASEIPAIARQFERSFRDLTAGEHQFSSSIARELRATTLADRLRASVVSAPEPFGHSIFRPYRSLRARNGHGPFRDSIGHLTRTGRSQQQAPWLRDCRCIQLRQVPRWTGMVPPASMSIEPQELHDSRCLVPCRRANTAGVSGTLLHLQTPCHTGGLWTV